jgi:hypothetical protein
MATAIWGRRASLLAVQTTLHGSARMWGESNDRPAPPYGSEMACQVTPPSWDSNQLASNPVDTSARPNAART